MHKLPSPARGLWIQTMSVHYADLRAEVRRLASLTAVSDGVAAMMVMTLGVMAMARAVPYSLRAALVEACARWFAGVQPNGSLEEARVECWKFLEAKYGNSTTVEDREDLAIRALICILWDEANEGDDLETGLDFFAQIADRFGGLEAVLGLSN